MTNPLPISGTAPICVALLALLSTALSGCGYSVGYDDFGPAGRRVTLEVVGNDTQRQRFELPITRALEQELPIHSNWQLVGPDQATSVLRARIVSVRGSSLSGGTIPAPVREGGLDFILEAELVDRRTGRVLRQARILDRAEFRTTIGETQGSALAEASRDIARKIIQRLETPL